MKQMSVIQEFVAFIKGFGVIGLAIGVVIGSAVTKLVTALVEDLINPVVGAVLNGVDFKGLVLKLNGDSVIRYGAFISSLIDFVIVLAVIWVAVKLIVGRMLSADEKAKLGM
jgi:large conductance mechanosensitive channel